MVWQKDTDSESAEFKLIAETDTEENYGGTAIQFLFDSSTLLNNDGDVDQEFRVFASSQTNGDYYQWGTTDKANIYISNENLANRDDSSPAIQSTATTVVANSDGSGYVAFTIA